MFEALENSEFSALVRGELWGWPLALTVHALGTAVTIGLMFVISLRLLGVFETIPYPALRRLFPMLWAAFAVQILSGLALWVTKPTRYVADAAFMLKILLVIVGMVLSVYFYRTLKREAGAWEAAGTVSSGAVKFGAASLVLWCLVLVAGRLTTYLGALYAG